MSPVVHETDQSAVWGTLVVILLVVIAILLVGYLAWWSPAHRETTIIQTPEREVVPVPEEREPAQPAPPPPAQPAEPGQGG